MRIIAGHLRRQPLKAPRGHLTRPTSDRTRESLFNLVASRLALQGADVLDLFAGTGALGLEAISRGALAATFVERNGAVLKYTRRNAIDLGVAEACAFVRADAVAYLERYNGPPFDLILADPPYDLEGLARLPDLALPHLRPHGLFVLEHDTRHDFEDHPALDTSRAYGRTIVSVFRPVPPADAPTASTP
ncbi:MAG: 16S rRNA (guanine(966)-N(2))-methyltransferase RsmD [Bacteroidetes bacterium]|nr:MAG: 16S rRNA (guanine(966)-N(2))-methyltransferase RsmD [Bacteroidota bacterium]